MNGRIMTRIRISSRRARKQRGNEMIEFALLSVFLVPLLLWTFIAGMNLIRLIQRASRSAAKSEELCTSAA